MYTLRVLRESLPTFLPKNRVRRKTEAGHGARRDVHAGGSWWAPLRPLRLMLSSGHATHPAQGSGREGAWNANSPRLLLGLGRLGDGEGAWNANSPRLLLGGGGWETERRACSGELVGSASQLSFNAQLGPRNSPLCLGRVAAQGC